jgi:dinuclear metal center YbgI/SA1388 family protein
MSDQQSSRSEMTIGARASPTIALDKIITYLDQLLETSITPDYPNALNGLQRSNKGFVTKVAAAVDFSTTTVHAAIREKANLLIVHHGMFWAGLKPLTGKTYQQMRNLLDADIAVYSSHLPLDRHSRLGNNVLLAKQLDLEPLQPFARFDKIFIGTQGVADIRMSTLVTRAQAFARSNGGDVITTDGTDSNRITRRWAICTGAGASAETLAEASQDGIDTLIVGEGPHWTAIDAAERGIAIIYLGHYASETLGIYALADDLNREFHLDCVKISAPTGL